METTGNTIRNWTEELPAEFRGKSSKINKLTLCNPVGRFLLCGPSGAGKNTILFDYIKRCPNIYAHIHICGRQTDQPLYRYMKDKLGPEFITIYEDGFIPDLDSIQALSKPQIIVFDDFSADKGKIQRDKIFPYFIRARHKKIACFMLVHSYHSSCLKEIRLQCNYIILLKINSIRDLKFILGDFSIRNCDLKTLLRYYQEATSERGQFLMVDTLAEQLRFNWLKPIIIHGDEKRLL